MLITHQNGLFVEIQVPKRKNILINYQRLRELLGFESYNEVKFYHKKWLDYYLENGKNIRDDNWRGNA